MTNQTRTPAGTPTGGQFAATSHAEATVTLDDDELFDARQLATELYSGFNATYEFASTGTVSPRGFDAWERELAWMRRSQTPDLEVIEGTERIVAAMAQIAREKGVCLDEDAFAEETGLEDDVAEAAWYDYSKTGEPLAEWWAEHQGRYI